MSKSLGMLPETERRLHRALFDGLLLTGELPNADPLSEAAGIDPTDIPARLRALEAADYLALDADGWPICLYPLSPTSTPHVVAFDGLRRFAMCSIDALGMAAMLNREIEITSACAVCHAPIHLHVSPGSITSVEPAGAVVVAGPDADRPACESCCPSTNFACGLEHGQALASRLPNLTVMTLTEALISGETIFAGMLGEQLPAHRPRMHNLEPNRGT
jgi:Alkylmercury lyase